MPELPEVETIKQDILNILPGFTIKDIQVFWKKSLENSTPEKLSTLLHKQIIKTISRRAKYLVIAFEQGCFLTLHLRMSGQLLIEETIPEDTKLLSLAITFKEGIHLILYDQRRFGRVAYLKDEDELLQYYLAKKLGTEPLSPEFSTKKLQDLLSGKTQRIKSFLLDQQYVVGIGNIYANEILWEAHIHPSSVAGKLKEQEIKALHASIRLILSKAIEKRGTSLSDYRDALGVEGEFQHYLVVHKQEGKPCYRCKTTKIKKIKLDQRSTYFCPKCQK